MSFITKSAVFLLLVVAIPVLLDYALRKEFPVYDHGSGSGIGRDATIELAKLGYTVFAGVRKEKDVESLKGEAKHLTKGEIIPVIMDVNDDVSVTATLETVTKYVENRNMPFVGLVNNAGLGGRWPFESTNIDKLKQMFDTNFFSVLQITKKFLPLIRKHKSRILFISSLHGIVALKGSTAYAGTKHALEAAADALRLEMIDFGVSVSVIQPGYINTAFGESAIVNTDQESVSEEQRLVYKEFWDTFASKRRAAFKASDPPEVTSKVIVHALTDKFPRTRYAVGPAIFRLPALVIVWWDALFPDRLSDLLRRN